MFMNISQPEINDQLELSTFTQLHRQKSVEDAKFDKQESTKFDYKNVEIIQSIITNSNTQESNFQGSKWRDVIVKSSNFSACKLSDNKITRVKFDGCRMQGIDFNSSELLDVEFINCNLDLSNFRMTQLRSVRFDNCSMIESEFTAGDLKGVIVKDCVLEKVDFVDIKINNVDLSGSQLIDVSGIKGLKGATIDYTQLISLAPELAQSIGLKIK